jgi:hypothetical protein
MQEPMMSHMIELPDALYAALLEAADTSGLTPVDWIAVHLLDAHGKKEIEGEQMSHARTLADLFAGRVGRIRSGSKEQLSVECGAKLTDYLEEKRRSGHL